MRNRDTRIMRAKKIDFQKMGAVHCFFLLRPYLFLFHGCRAHRATISSFFVTAHYFQNKSRATWTSFLYFFYSVVISCIHRTFVKKRTKNKVGRGAHCAPIAFLFFRSLCSKKIMGGAPMRPCFFFRPGSWYP